MKRVGFLWEKFVSEENILRAIKEVNKTHRTKYGRPNKKVKWVEATIEDRVEDLRRLVENNFIPAETKEK